MQKTVSVLGRIVKGSEGSIIRQLERLEGVVEARLVFGKCDFFARINTEMVELENTLESIESIKSVEHVRIVLPRRIGGGESCSSV